MSGERTNVVVLDPRTHGHATGRRSLTEEERAEVWADIGAILEAAARRIAAEDADGVAAPREGDK